MHHFISCTCTFPCSLILCTKPDQLQWYNSTVIDAVQRSTLSIMYGCSALSLQLQEFESDTKLDTNLKKSVVVAPPAWLCNINMQCSVKHTLTDYTSCVHTHAYLYDLRYQWQYKPTTAARTANSTTTGTTTASTIPLMLESSLLPDPVWYESVPTEKFRFCPANTCMDGWSSELSVVFWNRAMLILNCMTFREKRDIT